MNCSSIVSVISFNTTPPEIYYNYGLDVFLFMDLVYKNAILHVPEGCANSYKNAEYWKNFYNIKEDALTGIDGVRADNEDDKQREETVIYTLNGVKLSTTNVSELPKGIYIVNGNKVAVK